jgi:hypothetical protein
MTTRLLSYANVVSTLALVITLGASTSYAVSKALPENSVGKKQIKAKAVRSDEVKDGSILTRDLADGSITSTKIANGAVGLADLDGPSLSALSKPRAYGVFSSSGTLVASRSANVTVTRLDEGDYCVNPTSVEPTSTTIIATPDFVDGDGLSHIVQVVWGTIAGPPPACPNGFHLQTAYEVGGSFVNEDVAVHFVIP